MMPANPGIKAILHELSRQHACDGHVDIALAQLLAGELSRPCDEIDAKILRHLFILQAHVISDLRKSLGDGPDSRRLDEVLALQSAIRAHLG